MQHVTPEVLVGAPELAVLALLEESLHIAALALRAAQPALVRLGPLPIQEVVEYEKAIYWSNVGLITSQLYDGQVFKIAKP